VVRIQEMRYSILTALIPTSPSRLRTIEYQQMAICVTACVATAKTLCRQSQCGNQSQRGETHSGLTPKRRYPCRTVPDHRRQQEDEALHP
jgi:hypothetical protein